MALVSFPSRLVTRTLLVLLLAALVSSKAEPKITRQGYAALNRRESVFVGIKRWLQLVWIREIHLITCWPYIIKPAHLRGKMDRLTTQEN
uniref:Uncharacterized protein n=1 Tax=Aegilops tauschii TaxID=37682 RepID=M8CIW6_AEGTA